MVAPSPCGEYFIASETKTITAHGTENSFATGYGINSNGDVWAQVSGNTDFRDIPQGTHYFGKRERPTSKQWTMTDLPSKQPVGTAKAKEFPKRHIGDEKGGEGGIWDDRPFWTPPDEDHPNGQNFPHGGWRTGVCYHYDGGPAGTAGCPGYPDPNAKDLIQTEDETVTVEYPQNEAAVRARVEEIRKQLGRTDPVDWDKLVPVRTPTAGSGGGKQSKNKQGKKSKKGHSKVLVGQNHREILHEQALFEGGTLVSQGNPFLRVGEEQHPVSCVEHMTTDGSPIDSGDESVLMSV